MRRINLSVLLLITLINVSISQNTNVTQNSYYQEVFNNNPNWLVEDFHLDGDFHLTLAHEKHVLGGFTYHQIPILLKNKVSKKFSILRGFKFDLLRGDDWDPNIPFYGTIGGQLDIRDDAFIQATYNYKLNNATFNNVYFNDLKSQINLSAGFKF